MAASKCLYSDQPHPTEADRKKQDTEGGCPSQKRLPNNHLIHTAMFDPEKDRLHAINHRLDQLRGYL